MLHQNCPTQSHHSQLEVAAAQGAIDVEGLYTPTAGSVWHQCWRWHRKAWRELSPQSTNAVFNSSHSSACHPKADAWWLWSDCSCQLLQMRNDNMFWGSVRFRRLSRGYLHSPRSARVLQEYKLSSSMHHLRDPNAPWQVREDMQKCRLHSSWLCLAKELQHRRLTGCPGPLPLGETHKLCFKETVAISHFTWYFGWCFL